MEHSLEIQLPFLQVVLGDFKIVPILMGEQNYATCELLADTLVRALNNDKKTLLLSSTDLSHDYPYDRAVEMDRVFAGHVREMDAQGLSRALLSGTCEACGGGPTVTLLLAAKAMGCKSCRILKTANSGDVTGNRKGRIVGYLSAAVMD
jgi:AmmeMemoRadiSam system protein B